MTRMHEMHKDASRPVDPARRSRYGKIKIAVRDLGIDDDTYRALLGKLFSGATSSTQLTIPQLDRLLEHFKSQGFTDRSKARKRSPKRAGGRPLADGEQARKIRALWLSLYHLGVVRDPAEKALATWVERTTRVAALQWLDPESGTKAIEGLKAWAARDGGVDWSREGLGRWEVYLPAGSREPFAVVAAQWARMCALGVIQYPDQPWWGFAYAVVGKSAPHFYDAGDWHRLMEAFGRAIRQAPARAGS